MDDKFTETIERKSEELKALREEMQLRMSKGDGSLSRMSGQDVEKLIYALSTYQAELEMQNEELRQAQIEISDARDKYADLYDFVPVGCLTVQENGRILDANLTACRMLEIEPSELKKLGFSTFVSDSHQHVFYAHRLELLEKLGSAVCEIEMKKADGNSFWAQLKSWIVEKDVELRRWRTAIIDISEQKDAEADKALLNQQLQHMQKLETLGTLSAGIAHDFNNLLSPIIGIADSAVIKLPPDDPHLKEMKEVLKCAERAADLVRQILVFSGKAESGTKSSLMQDVIRDAVRFLRATLPSTVGIRESVNVESDLVEIDPTKINQVILNLGTNAVRAIGEKSGNLFVGIEEIEVDDAVSTEFPNLPKGKAFLLVVRDTGCGMDERTVQRIYDPFFSSWERSTGTGLGLSVVHGIVNSCNGVISVSSTPGEGSEFSIYLPKICASAVKVEDEQSTVRGGNEHILLVDDEEEVAGVYEKILNTLGYSVSVEFDGISALKLFESDPSKYDLVITDQTMPGLSGLRLSRRLLALRPDIPILIMSGFIEKLDPEVLREVGIKHLLSKPVRARDLAKTIRQVLDR